MRSTTHMINAILCEKCYRFTMREKQNQKIKEIRNASAIQRNNKLRMKTNQEVQKGKNVDKGIVC